MSNTSSAVSSLRSNIRRLAWLAIGMAVLSLVFVAMGARSGGSIHWWAWALPCLVMVNASVALLGVPTQQRLTRWFPWFTIAVAVAIIVAQAFYFTGKFRG